MRKSFIRGLALSAMLMAPVTSYGATIGSGSASGVTKQLSDTTFKFNMNHPTVKSKGYTAYGNHIYTKNYYGGQFPIYMPFTTNAAAPWNDIVNYIRENTQTKLGHGGAHLVPGYLNIKKGKKDPNIWDASAYQGDNSGHMWVPSLKLNVEYRYQGYLTDGTVVDNPYFPDDVYGGVAPWDKKWKRIEDVTWTYFKPSHYNDKSKKIANSDISYAQKTFETWFANSEMGAKFKAKTPPGWQGIEWAYWNQFFQIQGDITEGSVIITGWHQTSSGRRYYQSFAIPSRPNNNITVTEFELVDPDTGDVLENFYRKIDMKDPINTNAMKITKTDGKAVLDKGKKYILRGKTYYTGLEDPSKSLTKLSKRALKTTPAFMDLYYAYDANVSKENKFDDQEAVNATGGTGGAARSVMPGEEMEFELEFVVPKTVKDQGAIQFKVPEDYLKNGDNAVKDDDYAIIRYKVADNDLGMTGIDLKYRGQSIDYVVPGDSHTVIFDVGHILGNTTIGEGNTNLTVDINIKDTANNILQRETVTVSEPLAPGKTVEVVSKPVNPSSDGIMACATINKVHAQEGLNSDPSNDTICKTFKGTKNYAIKDLKITPHLIQLEEGVGSKTQPLSFTFVASNEGKNEGDSENPLVVISKNGSTIWSGRINVAVGEEVQETITIPVSMGVGNHTFKVEINPEPREVKEFKTNGNPYGDNYKTDAVVVKRYVECVDCTDQNTGNSWQEKFSWVEKFGEWRTYTKCDDDGDCWEETYCAIVKTNRWSEVHSFNESYKISNVYFRSKWSKDTKGGDGWIDLLTTSGNKR